MSQERQERRREEAAIASGAKSSSQKRLIKIVLVIAAFAVVYGLGVLSRTNRTVQRMLGQRKYDGFAQCLNERGVKFYGAWWCPHCEEQKEKFGASIDLVPYIECGVKGDTHGKSQACKDANITRYPTWQFPPTGERVERVFSLEELRDRTGCALP